ncbi:MAG: hypothetical protein GX422_06810 [Deltaproteobacteria bacterium]|nr:hypothetical protein [Deltaproteobacteria bacterium]
MDAIQNLRSDSLSILFLLEIFEAVLERMAAGRAVDCDHLNRLLELLRMKCRSHEEKLEKVFFPALENARFHYLGTDSLAMLLGTASEEVACAR